MFMRRQRCPIIRLLRILIEHASLGWYYRTIILTYVNEQCSHANEDPLMQIHQRRRLKCFISACSDSVLRVWSLLWYVIGIYQLGMKKEWQQNVPEWTNLDHNTASIAVKCKAPAMQASGDLLDANQRTNVAHVTMPVFESRNTICRTLKVQRTMWILKYNYRKFIWFIFGGNSEISFILNSILYFLYWFQNHNGWCSRLRVFKIKSNKENHDVLV